MSSRWQRLGLVLACVWAFQPAAARAANGGIVYHVVDLGGIAEGSGATSLARSGLAAGYELLGPSEPHAVLFTGGGTAKDLGTLGGDASLANAVNAAGMVVGWARLADETHHAFAWADGVMHDLGTLGGSSSLAFAVNDSGLIAGSSYTAGDTMQVPCLWTLAGGSRQLPLGDIRGGQAYAINAAGTVAGWYSDSVRSHAFTFDRAGNMVVLPDDGPPSKAYGISDNGIVVGYVITPGVYPKFHASLWRGGSMRDLGTLAGGHSVAYAVNRAGQAVGFSYRIDDQMVATAFTDSGVVDLNGVLRDSTGWVLEMATGLTEDGVISGVGLKDGLSRAFALVPVSLQNGPWGIPIAYNNVGLAGYPMPMYSSGRLEVQLPVAANGQLELYDVAGRRLAELARGPFGAGRTTVALSSSLLSRLGAGVYYARLSTEQGARTLRVVLLH